MNEDLLILNSIKEICAGKPHLLPKIIEYATAGVKQFAEKQSDKTSRMEVIHGTPWHNKELQRLGKS